MLNPRIELAITFTFVVAILFGLFQTSRIDLAFSSDLETFSGPRAYPGLILSIILVLFSSIAAVQFRDVIRNSSRAVKHKPFLDNRTKYSGVLFISLIVFVLVFESIGYILTMVPILIIASLLCGARNSVHIFLVAVCLAAVCLVVFRFGLATVLPEGIFGIDTVL